jgi:hypothetical protein
MFKKGVVNSIGDLTAQAMNAGFMPIITPIDAAAGTDIEVPTGSVIWEDTGKPGEGVWHDNTSTDSITANGTSTYYSIKFVPLNGAGPGGGGGGGGGGGPKKVANKRKSQTVKRYKKNDARRSSAQSFKKSAEKSKDYLYGESKIA